MKHRWTTLLWELWAAQALCAVAALPPGSAFHTCPALALPGLALAAAVPTAWAAWALLAEPPDGLPPEQLLPALRILIFYYRATPHNCSFGLRRIFFTDPSVRKV